MTIKRRRILKPFHQPPGRFSFDFILLPCGYMLNREFNEAVKGDVLQFSDGSRREILLASRIPMDKCCEGLCHMRYGVGMLAVLRKWRKNAILLGAGVDSVSDEECLIVFYGKEIR